MDRRYQYSPALGLLQQSHDRLAQQLDQLQAGRGLRDPQELIGTILAFRKSGGARCRYRARQIPLRRKLQRQQSTKKALSR